METYVREKRSSQAGGASAREARASQVCEEASGRSRHAPAEPASASSSSTRPPAYLQIPDPPRVSPPDVPQSTATNFSTVQSDVRAGALRVEISDLEQWSPGDIAVLKNQEAKRVRDIGQPE